jgi:hypothetical protein
MAKKLLVMAMLGVVSLTLLAACPSKCPEDCKKTAKEQRKTCDGDSCKRIDDDFQACMKICDRK